MVTCYITMEKTSWTYSIIVRFSDTGWYWPDTNPTPKETGFGSGSRLAPVPDSNIYICRCEHYRRIKSKLEKIWRKTIELLIIHYHGWLIFYKISWGRIYICRNKKYQSFFIIISTILENIFREMFRKSFEYIWSHWFRKFLQL